MKIYFLSKNEHKLREIRSFLEPYGFEVEIMFEDKMEIQSDSLAEIVKKAVEFVGRRKYAFFAEDAGLFIDHLNGFPGPYSSYVYKTIGIDGILKLMLGVEDRKAT
ncbi:MAG: non-canonical purine NTP pyrophosphatase, partial [Thermoprotei archaeon]